MMIFVIYDIDEFVYLGNEFVIFKVKLGNIYKLMFIDLVYL